MSGSGGIQRTQVRNKEAEANGARERNMKRERWRQNRRQRDKGHSRFLLSLHLSISLFLSLSLYLSAISLWDITVTHFRKRWSLSLPSHFRNGILRRVTQRGISSLPSGFKKLQM
jgi:hypothetical protein